MPDISQSTWSETDSANNAAPPNGWPEGQAPSSVNDCARMMMGAVKRSWDRDHAASGVTVGGTPNAVALTYGQGPSAYLQGEKFAFKAAAANTGAATLNVNGLGAKNVFRRMIGGPPAALVGGEWQPGDLVDVEYDGTQFLLMTPAAGTGGRIAQIVTFETGAVATGTTQIPGDDTIPQNTEGDQYMALSITPTNPNSTLLIDIVWIGATSATTGAIGVALFQDSTVNAVAAAAQNVIGAATLVTVSFRHRMTAVTTSPTTFKVRAGLNAPGTTTFNGFFAGRMYGGVMGSSIMISEILP